MSEPAIYTGEHRGSSIIGIVHKDRKVDITFSPKGKSVRVWIDDEEVHAAPTVRAHYPKETP